MPRYRVTGSDSASSGAMELTLDAPNAAEATAKAERLGLIVTGLKVASAGAQETPLARPGSVEAPAPSEPVESRPRGRSRQPRPRGFWIALTQAVQVALIGLLVAFFGSIEDDLVPALIYAGVLILMQRLLLLPISRPQVKPGKSQHWLVWVSAAVAGLLAGICAATVIGLLGDFLWGVGVIPTEGDSMSSAAAQALGIGGFAVLAATWIVATPLLVAFMRKGPPERRLCQVAASLFLGTVVEALAAIPIASMVGRRTSCSCATFSAISVFLSLALGFIVLGPAIILVVIYHRSRAAAQGRCAACGYDLRGLTDRGRCPECGAGWKVAAPAVS